MEKTIRKGISLILVLCLLILNPMKVNAAQSSKEMAASLQNKYGMKVTFNSDFPESDKLSLINQLDSAFSHIGTEFVKEVVSVYTQNGYTASISVGKTMWGDTMGTFGVSKKNAVLEVLTYKTLNPEKFVMDPFTVAHEFGHMVQYSFDIKKGPSYVINKWNACGSGVYVSDYASTSQREDFAETFAFITAGSHNQAVFLDMIAKDTTGILKKKVDCLDSILGEFKSFSTILKMYDFQGMTAYNRNVQISVNGKYFQLYLYNINGYNYIKIRDLAMLLSGTEKQFDVSWNSLNQTIVLKTGSPYTVMGGELAWPEGYMDKIVQTSAKIYIDDQEVSPTVYTISGYNYFKLRDIAEPLDFKVEWTTHALTIDTTTGYVE